MEDRITGDYTIRHYQHGDEQKMADLVNASSGEEEGMIVTADMIRDEWNDPRLDLERDSWVALNESGEYIAAAEVWFEEDDDEDEIITRHIGFTMRPEYRESHAALMEYLFNEALEHAQRRPPKYPEREYYLRTWASAGDLWKQEWVQSRGFEYVHCGFTMLHASLNHLPPIPQVEGARIEGWKLERDYDLWQALNTSFSSDWTFVPLSWEEWNRIYHSSEKIDPTLWRIAVDVDNDEIIGFALTEIEDIAMDFGSPQEGWITDLTVMEPWQGRGVRAALLIATLHALREAGMSAVMAGVDSYEPLSATQLYESAGFRLLRGSCTFHQPMNVATMAR